MAVFGVWLLESERNQEYCSKHETPNTRHSTEDTRMGFIRQQECKFAIRLLGWRYEKLGLPLPAADELERQAARIVDQAHLIARERGRNVMAIMRDLSRDLIKK
jgi:hypothetical protein